MEAGPCVIDDESLADGELEGSEVEDEASCVVDDEALADGGLEESAEVKGEASCVIVDDELEAEASTSQ